MKRIIAIFLMFLLVVSCGTSPEPEKASTAEEAAAEKPTYRIGYMICNSEQETLDRFLPLTAYLSQELGVNFEAVAIDTIQFMKEVDGLDFTHSNSLLYIMMQRLKGVEILAAEQKGSLGHLSQGVIITKSDSDIKTVADLKGKTMIFGPSLAPTGFMSQVDTLQQNGIDPEDDLAFYTIPSGSFKHEKVAYAVLFDKYDAGALPLDDIDIMAKAGRIAEDDFTVIGKGPAMPYCNFGVTQKVDEDLAARFKEAILAITADDTVNYDGEEVKILKRALVDGFIDIQDADFDIVREIAKRTNMPPYQSY